MKKSLNETCLVLSSLHTLWFITVKCSHNVIQKRTQKAKFLDFFRFFISSNMVVLSPFYCISQMVFHNTYTMKHHFLLVLQHNKCTLLYRHASIIFLLLHFLRQVGITNSKCNVIGMSIKSLWMPKKCSHTIRVFFINLRQFMRKISIVDMFHVQ